MKKKFMAGLVLGLSMAANLAYAEIATDYLPNVFVENNDWSLAAICTGSDVMMIADATTEIEQFREAFLASKIYDGERLAEATGVEFKYSPELVKNLEEEVFHYAPHKYNVGYNEVHGAKHGDGSFETIGVIIGDPSYKIAGLEVGQKFIPEVLKEFSKNMNMIGWESTREINEETKKCNWYLYGNVDGQQRRVEGFGIRISNGYISEIRYWRVPID